MFDVMTLIAQTYIFVCNFHFQPSVRNFTKDFNQKVLKLSRGFSLHMEEYKRK